MLNPYLPNKASLGLFGAGMEYRRKTCLKSQPSCTETAWLITPANLRLMASRAAGNITHAVLPLHLSTVGHFHLQA